MHTEVSLFRKLLHFVCGIICIFLLTADTRGRTQIFLPADQAGKKHVNRFAINNVYMHVFIYRCKSYNKPVIDVEIYMLWARLFILL